MGNKVYSLLYYRHYSYSANDAPSHCCPCIYNDDDTLFAFFLSLILNSYN